VLLTLVVTGISGIRLLGPGVPVQQLPVAGAEVFSDDKGGNRQVDGIPAEADDLSLRWSSGRTRT